MAKEKQKQAEVTDIRRRIDTQESVLVLDYPDKWPLRVEGLMNALTGIMTVLEICQPIVKAKKKEEAFLFDLVKAIHHEVCAAVAFVTVRSETVKDILERNDRGELFKGYLKGISGETLKEWKEMGLDTSMYKAKSSKQIGF